MYCIWKSIIDDDRTWVRLEAHFQGAYLDREEIEQTAGAAGYGSPNNANHGEIEDTFMNFATATEALDADFTYMTSTNGNLSDQFRHQEEHILPLQA